jgi:uncharacterized protein (TIGR03083 family)
VSDNRQRVDPPTATIAGMITTHLDEVTELFQAVLERPADAPTACAGWTAHDLLAHLAAGAEEEAVLIEAHLGGEPPRPTRALDERERPYRDLPDRDLRERLVAHGARLSDAIDRLRATGPDAAVAFTGRAMTAADFARHSRSECALHRWDLVGSDDISRDLLSRPELTIHALGVLTSMSTLTEAPAHRVGRSARLADAMVVLRAEPRGDAHEDLVVTVRGGEVSLALVTPGEGPVTVEVSPADRLLLLWGRRPAEEPRVLPTATQAERAVLGALFGVTAA